ncbi:MAG TPA: LapA family protein [Gammaproteobacteria bacterium]|nr:LapA family protein [Gammaproteobacteria bacterium]
MRIFYLLLFLLLVVIGIAFAVLNAEAVEFNYYFSSRQVPLSLILVLAMFSGAVLGVLASMGLIIRLKREALQLRRNAELAEKEIANLRAIPIKDKH